MSKNGKRHAFVNENRFRSSREFHSSGIFHSLSKQIKKTIACELFVSLLRIILSVANATGKLIASFTLIVFILTSSDVDYFIALIVFVSLKKIACWQHKFNFIVKLICSHISPFLLLSKIFHHIGFHSVNVLSTSCARNGVLIKCDHEISECLKCLN